MWLLVMQCYVSTVLLFPLFLPAKGQQFAGDLCTLKATGEPGECKLISDCPKVDDDLRNHRGFPQNCNFKGHIPIVCCPKGRKLGEISRKKCREYADFAYAVMESPILIPNAPKHRRFECGHEIVELISGGKPATKKEFPHMVALGKEQHDGLKWLCGGTLLSELFVLTAAHCLTDPYQGNMTHVRMGIIDLNSTFKRQDNKIAQWIAHPEYKYPSHYHDIGLVKLEKPANLNPYARPACLYYDSNVAADKAIATGWGDTTAEGDSQSTTLLKVTLMLVNNKQCNDSYKNSINRRFEKGIVEDIQLCAASDDDKKKDTCRGDSGGPLQVYHNETDAKCMYDVIGITSFGRPCSGSSSVYVRVSRYIKWIEDQVWPEE